MSLAASQPKDLRVKKLNKFVLVCMVLGLPLAGAGIYLALRFEQVSVKFKALVAKYREVSFVYPADHLDELVVTGSNSVLVLAACLLVLIVLAIVLRVPAPEIKQTSFMALGLCLILALTGVWAAVSAIEVYWIHYPDFIAEFKQVKLLYQQEGVQGLVQSFCVVCGIVAAFLLVASCLGILYKRRVILRVLRGACFAYYGLFLMLFYTVNRCAWLIFEKDITEVKGTGEGLDLATTDAFFWVWGNLWPYALLVAAFVLIHIQLWRRTSLNLYTSEREEAPAPGDAIVENIRSHGMDPQFRKSMLGSAFTHLAVILLIPWLIGLISCVRDYRVPKGSGNPVVALVRMVKPKKKKPKKNLILNPDSAIYFNQPDLDDNLLLKEVEKATDKVYERSRRGPGGMMGVGGGEEGGWPDGMEDHEIRFIRLKYNGRNWDDGMQPHTRADMNFLEYFQKLTKKKFKIAKMPEAHPISWLKSYRKGYAPPFVYMTGDRGIHISSRDITILRNYLLDGGMLFADCGGAAWDRAFRARVRQLFPEKPMAIISDDDPIFKFPFEFENGAPPLWHHGGFRALGVKHKGRWCIFYHPGDINDAWKLGASGLSKRESGQAYDMGVNIVYYSFTHYLELTRKYRKR